MLKAAVTLVLLLVLAVPADAAVVPGWSAAAPMEAPRRAHRAVLLDDGRVLVTGGRVDGGFESATDRAEIYDPRTGAWTPTVSMRAARANHILVKLHDGRVMAIGGTSETDFGLASAEIYDPASGRWTLVAPMSIVRSRAAGIVLGDGDVLVAGDNTGSGSTSAERFDVATATWQPAGSVPGGRYLLQLTSLADGRVLLAGGSGMGSPPTDAFYLYDPATNAWAIPATRMTQGRIDFGLVTLPDGRVLAVGGSPGGTGSATRTSEVYTPATGTWAGAGSMAADRQSHATVPLSGGRVLAIGGRVYPQTVLSGVEIFDPASGAWSSAGTLANPRADLAAVRLADGRVLATGGSVDLAGNAGGNPTNTVDLFTPATSLATAPGALGDQGTRIAGARGIAVTNTGDQPLLTEAFAVSGPNAAEFAVNGDACRVVEPGATCSIPVQFTPAALGTRSATLQFAANTAAGTHSVALSGRGVVGDRDGDGVLDANDRCKTRKGPKARKGCPKGLFADSSIRYTRSGGGIRVLAYYVQATKGARITVRCSKGCRKTVTKGKGSTRRVRISRLNGRRLAQGARITVSVSMSGRLTTKMTDRVSRGRRIEGRPRCAPVRC